jgi:DNA-binding MarR family transcriptional regulator
LHGSGKLPIAGVPFDKCGLACSSALRDYGRHIKQAPTPNDGAFDESGAGMTEIGNGLKDGIDIIVAEWDKTNEGIDLDLLEIHSRVSRVSLFAERHIEAHCREHGFGWGECDLLMTLRRGGPPYTRRPTDLSQASLVTSGVTTGRIDRLVALGLIERVSSTTDRRAAHVHLTQRGWDVSGVMLGVMRDSLLKAGGPFTADELATTISVLRRIGHALGDVPDQADAPAPQDWQKDSGGAKRRASKRG